MFGKANENKLGVAKNPEHSSYTIQECLVNMCNTISDWNIQIVHMEINVKTCIFLENWYCVKTLLNQEKLFICLQNFPPIFAYDAIKSSIFRGGVKFIHLWNSKSKKKKKNSMS